MEIQSKELNKKSGKDTDKANHRFIKKENKRTHMWVGGWFGWIIHRTKSTEKKGRLWERLISICELQPEGRSLQQKVARTWDASGPIVVKLVWFLIRTLGIIKCVIIKA